jgi:tetratricopeptide (TPR) repeat protein
MRLSWAVFLAIVFPFSVLAQVETRQPTPVVLLPDLGNHHHPIATKVPEAQRFFDQGLILTFGFNREEAMRSFRRAAELDPASPMPYWGIALALGPHLNMNLDMDVAHAEANAAIEKALALSKNSSPYERAYVEAMARRCTNLAHPDVAKLDANYSAAMAELAKNYPDDLDAAAFYAESLMDLHRYDWFDSSGNPTGPTNQILALLESILLRDPAHPLANHLYVHVLDTSPYPARALSAAAHLEHDVPGIGHVSHMGGHIYSSVGDFESAARANLAAAEADRRYMAATGISHSAYALSYYPHHVHFGAYALTEQGLASQAMASAEVLQAFCEPRIAEMPEMMDYFLRVPFLTLLRSQQWDQLLAYPQPVSHAIMSRALWHFARAMAFAAKKDSARAREEQRLLEESRKSIPAGTMFVFNPAGKIMELASAVLRARLSAGEESIALWQQAVALQDALLYDDPPAWNYPLRESLGAALYRTGRFAEAEQVFRENLRRNPRNPRGLFCLWRAVLAQGRNDDAEWIHRQFTEVWKGAILDPSLENF